MPSDAKELGADPRQEIVSDLRTDPRACTYVKHEVVDVCFARAAGTVLSREGPNRYRKGDAILTGSTGDRWSVSRERFDARYKALTGTTPGADGRYVSQPVPVVARQMGHDFTIARSAGGDLLRGLANDWLLQYAPGDYGVVENARFTRVYRRTDPQSGAD
ncbi:MAG: PGDYG domain-containing protein [Betaproteobacteria bacterium]|nr:PGDYG domain-containing protein [Betaproteobacteria bacterium]